MSNANTGATATQRAVPPAGDMRVNSDRVELGRVVITATALNVLDSHSVRQALANHQSGEWGLVSEALRSANAFSLGNGGRLLSMWLDDNQHEFWVLTESNRTFTTVLIPSEFHRE